MPKRLLRWILALKFAALFVIVGTVLSGHPPSGAQSQLPPFPVTTEDVRQDSDIGYLKAEIAARDVSIEKMQDTLTQQGKDLAALDTKMTFVFTLLGILQSGGLALHGYTLRRKSDAAGEGGE
jgi:hypothetical protein